MEMMVCIMYKFPIQGFCYPDPVGCRGGLHGLKNDTESGLAVVDNLLGIQPVGVGTIAGHSDDVE